jgi:hypothetical protein
MGVQPIIKVRDVAYPRLQVPDLDIYRVLAVFKLAVIIEGAHARIRATRPDTDTTSTAATVEELAALAIDLADASSISALHGT